MSKSDKFFENVPRHHALFFLEHSKALSFSPRKNGTIWVGKFGFGNFCWFWCTCSGLEIRLDLSPQWRLCLFHSACNLELWKCKVPLSWEQLFEGILAPIRFDCCHLWHRRSRTAVARCNANTQKKPRKNVKSIKLGLWKSHERSRGLDMKTGENFSVFCQLWSKTVSPVLLGYMQCLWGFFLKKKIRDSVN